MGRYSYIKIAFFFLFLSVIFYVGTLYISLLPFMADNESFYNSLYYNINNAVRFSGSICIAYLSMFAYEVAGKRRSVLFLKYFSIWVAAIQFVRLLFSLFIYNEITILEITIYILITILLLFLAHKSIKLK